MFVTYEIFDPSLDNLYEIVYDVICFVVSVFLL